MCSDRQTGQFASNPSNASESATRGWLRLGATIPALRAPRTAADPSPAYQSCSGGSAATRTPPRASKSPRAVAVRSCIDAAGATNVTPEDRGIDNVSV
eukprot:366259-Chlamydomonas_euryale.AAC.1